MIMCEGWFIELLILWWLCFVFMFDCVGLVWYIGVGFFFVLVLVVFLLWLIIIVVLWWIIGLVGLWFGLFGIVMVVGLVWVLCFGVEILEVYWCMLVDY